MSPSQKNGDLRLVQNTHTVRGNKAEMRSSLSSVQGLMLVNALAIKVVCGIDEEISAQQRSMTGVIRHVMQSFHAFDSMRGASIGCKRFIHC